MRQESCYMFCVHVPVRLGPLFRERAERARQDLRRAALVRAIHNMDLLALELRSQLRVERKDTRVVPPRHLPHEDLDKSYPVDNLCGQGTYARVWNSVCMHAHTCGRACTQVGQTSFLDKASEWELRADLVGRARA